MAGEEVIKDAVKYRRVEELKDPLKGRIEDHVKLYCVILHCKASSSSSKISFTKNFKTHTTYHRLVLCRELREGTTFIVMCEDVKASMNLFTIDMIGYLGSCFAMYEPVKQNKIFGIPQLYTKWPLLPIKMAIQHTKIPTILTSVTDSVKMDSFLIECEKISISHAELVPACGSEFCDCQHSDKQRCPGLSNTKEKRTVLSVRLNLDDHQMYSILFTSERFSRVFVADEILEQENSNDDGLTESVENTLRYYKERGVPFICLGWHKFSMVDGETASPCIKLKLSFCGPKLLKENAPKFQGVQAENVVLHAEATGLLSHHADRMVDDIIAEDSDGGAAEIIPNQVE